MNCIGKVVVFVEDKKAGDKTIRLFNTTISHKQEDGSYLNCNMEVRFAKDKYPEERLSKMDTNKCYPIELTDAWLSCRSFKTKDGKEARVPYLQVNSAKWDKPKDITKVEQENIDLPSDDLPF